MFRPLNEVEKKHKSGLRFCTVLHMTAECVILSWKLSVQNHLKVVQRWPREEPEYL